MAQITIAGNAVVVKSSMTIDDIKTILRYRPESLILREEKGEEKFRIGVTSGNGEVTKYGIKYSVVSRNENGYATATVFLDELEMAETEDDARNIIADSVIGQAIKNISAIEESLPGVLDSIRWEKNQINQSITIID